MSDEVSLVRLYLLRGMYLANTALLGLGIWPQLIGLHSAYEPLPAVVFCFWAALGALSGVGLRYPLAMVPLLLLQFSYKTLWILAVWLPLWVAGTATDMDVGSLDLSVMFIGGMVMDLVVIPWPYVVTRFVRTHGDRWKREDEQTVRSSPPRVRDGIPTR